MAEQIPIEQVPREFKDIIEKIRESAAKLERRHQAEAEYSKRDPEFDKDFRTGLLMRLREFAGKVKPYISRDDQLRGHYNNMISALRVLDDAVREFQGKKRHGNFKSVIDDKQGEITKLLTALGGIQDILPRFWSTPAAARTPEGPTEEQIDRARVDAEEVTQAVEGEREMPAEQIEKKEDDISEVIREVGKTLEKSDDKEAKEIGKEVKKVGEGIKKKESILEHIKRIEQRIQQEIVQIKLYPILNEMRTRKFTDLLQKVRKYEELKGRDTGALAYFVDLFDTYLNSKSNMGKKYLKKLKEYMEKHRQSEIVEIIKQCDHAIREFNEIARKKDYNLYISGIKKLRGVLAGHHRTFSKDTNPTDRLRALDRGLIAILYRVRDYLFLTKLDKDKAFGGRVRQLTGWLNNTTKRRIPITKNQIVYYYLELHRRPYDTSLLKDLRDYLMRGYNVANFDPLHGPGPIALIRNIIKLFDDMEKAKAIPEKGKPIPPKVKEDVPRQLDEMERFIDAELREAKMQGFSEKGYSTGSFVYDLVHQRVKRVTFIPHLAQAWAGISKAYNQVELETTMRGVEFEGEYEKKLKSLRKRFKEAEEIYKRQKDKLENYDKWIEKVKEMWRKQGDPNLEDKGKIEEAIKGDKEFKMIRNFMKDIAALIRKFRGIKKSIIELEEIWFK